jgi:hypothetical protein
MLNASRSSRDKVRLHRERLRAQGLRPIQIWVPDVRARSFITAARKQSTAVASSPILVVLGFGLHSPQAGATWCVIA